MRKIKLTLGTGTLAALKDMILKAYPPRKRKKKGAAKGRRSKETTSVLKRDQ